MLRYNTNQRESGIELLRIVAMAAIVIHHLIVHGSDFDQIISFPNTLGTYQKLLFESFVLFPVDCFLFISGFFGINLKVNKLVSFWFQCFTYSVLITLIFSFLNIETFHLSSLLPITSNTWWFISCYVFLMLLSPVINYLVTLLQKDMFRYLLIVLFILNSIVSYFSISPALAYNGSSLTSFIFIYLLGRYFNLYKKTASISSVRLIFIYILACLLVFIGTVVMLKYGNYTKIWQIYQYNNPVIILEAISMFYIFKKMKISNRVINYFGGMIFAVYLIHDHRLVRGYIYNNILMIKFHYNSMYYILYLLLFTIIVMVVSFLIEIVRKQISDPILGYVYNSNIYHNIEKKYSKIIAKFTVEKV